MHCGLTPRFGFLVYLRETSVAIESIKEFAARSIKQVIRLSSIPASTPYSGIAG
jgi:hypothetical protein